MSFLYLADAVRLLSGNSKYNSRTTIGMRIKSNEVYLNASLSINTCFTNN